MMEVKGLYPPAVDKNQAKFVQSDVEVLKNLITESKHENHKMFEILNMFITNLHIDYRTRITLLETLVAQICSHMLACVDAGSYKDADNLFKVYSDNLHKELAENAKQFDLKQKEIEVKYKDIIKE